MVLFSATETQIQGQTELVVTMEQFGKVLAWFGNLKTDGAGILEKVIYIFILFSFPLMKLRIPLYIYLSFNRSHTQCHTDGSTEIYLCPRVRLASVPSLRELSWFASVLPKLVFSLFQRYF